MSSVMKDSGIEWIGEVPVDWQSSRLKDYYNFEKGKNASQFTQEYIGENRGVYPLYSGQTESDGVMGLINKYDYDLDECLFTTTVGAKVMTPKILKGKFSLSQNCLIMKKIGECDNRFIFFILNPLFNYEKSLIPSYMQPSLRMSDLNRYQIYLPNLEEQKKIANYLDFCCSLINQTIDKQKLSIEKLNIYKQSIITEAVTKGLNSNIPMKDSGIEWIGEIPANWKVKRMKYFGALDANGVDKKIREDEPKFKSIHYMDTYRGSLNEIGDNENYITISTSDDKAEKCKLLKGDVLFTNSSETPDDIGHSTVIKENLKDTLFGYHLMRFRPIEKFVIEYEKYLFGSYYMRQWFAYCAIGMTRYGINRDAFTNAKLIVAPIDEQEKISKYLDKKLKVINNSIENKYKVITKLESYKKSLIYECVTGKREVK